MKNNDTQNSAPKTEKTSWEDNFSEVIRSIISKNPKKIYPLCDIFCKEITTKHGRADLYRAFFSSMFHPKLSAKAATELISRRKCLYEPWRNLDLSDFGDLISLSLQILSWYIVADPESPFKPVFIEHLPEMLAAINPQERDMAYRRAALLTYGRETRKKGVKEDQVITTEEPLNNDIVEVIEPEIPTTVSIHEPESELETVSELVTVTEIASDATLNLQDPIANIPILPENIPEFVMDPILAVTPESPKIYKPLDLSGI